VPEPAQKRARVTKPPRRIALFISVFLVLLLTLPFFTPFYGINCEEDMLDIPSGRHRYTKHLYWFKIRDRVEETKLSRLYRELVGEPPEPQWRCVYFRTPGTFMHPVYHGAFVHEERLLLAFAEAEFTPQAKRTAILNFLSLLQKHRGDYEAGRYAGFLLESTYTVARAGKEALDVNDVAIPPQAP